MESIPRDYDGQRRFDAFCKTVLRNEARSYMRSLCRQRKHEFSLYAVPWEEMDKLCTRTLYDETGCPHRCVDEYMKHRLEAKLTQAIIFMN